MSELTKFCYPFQQQLAKYGVDARVWEKGARVYLDTAKHIKCWFSQDDSSVFVENRGQPQSWVTSQKNQFLTCRSHLVAAALYNNGFALETAFEPELDPADHTEPMHVLDDGDMIVFITDVATVCGVHTGSDGAFLAEFQKNGRYKLVVPDFN